MQRRFKGFSLTPWDIADVHSDPIRPLDECFNLEMSYWGAATTGT